MNRLVLLFLTLYSLPLAAQQVNQCGIIVPPQRMNSSFNSVYEAEGYIKNMLEQINWKENFQIREQNGINNAYATIIRNERYIVYDNNFLENLDAYAATKWASISVLAHEMGHHYRNHVVDSKGSTPPKELEADYFSGYVMAKLGATLDESMAAMNKIASARASNSHPAKESRLDAITKGWNYAKGITDTPKPPKPTQPNPQQNPQQPQIPPSTPAPPPQQTPPPPAEDASWIYLSLYGNTDMMVYLSDNGKDFNAASLKTTQPFVFKFEIYKYGWMRFTNDSNAERFTLRHGRDYAIVWSRRKNGWTVVQVP